MLLLFEAVLAYAICGVGEGVFIEGLEAELILVRLFERGDAGMRGSKGGLEVDCCGL